jgi:hypothetical protein
LPGRHEGGFGKNRLPKRGGGRKHPDNPEVSDKSTIEWTDTTWHPVRGHGL